ncbi:DUF4390 domain-containing protein [Hydrogenophaga crassostreae]|uniref:DUF4390 domain-containing protein n=1 Tax=Hydrogenophaga crassostreae TaxID=1763535 RepID=UPI0012FDE075|nr:DUF4390 domain-containing protein [Hydrogenophaga crassostreae]
MNNRRGFGWLLRVWVVLWVFCIGSGAALANEPHIVSSSLQRTAQGVRLNVRLDLQATPAVEQALIKGVPMYFVWRAEMIRDRWYWYDKKEVSVSRTLRLAYQPLTRRWRLSVSIEGDADSGTPGLNYALHQSFDSLNEALAVVGRVAGWRVAEASNMSEGDLRVEWRFELELALLPRPFQLGMANEPDWNISVQQRLDVPSQAQPDTDQADDLPAPAAVPGGVK